MEVREAAIVSEPILSRDATSLSHGLPLQRRRRLKLDPLAARQPPSRLCEASSSDDKPLRSRFRKKPEGAADFTYAEDSSVQSLDQE